MKKLVTVMSALVLLLTFAGSATANTGKHARLRLTATGNAEIGWTVGKDSPLDGNRWALNMSLNGPTYSGYTNAFAPWLTRNDGGKTVLAAGSVRNLSFDFLNASGGGYVGAAPRISVVFTSGLVAYLEAFYCDKVIAEGDGTWSRADFTGQKAVGCTISDSNGGWWASDGTHSAWQVFLAANPGLYVDYGVVVQDESDMSPLRARIDRIAMQNHMQTGPTRVVHCPTELSC
jgi:hypothetical protein